MKPTNQVIMTGHITINPIWSPGNSGSIDFELKNRDGRHQIVSYEPEVVKNRKNIRGLVKVYGKLCCLKEDTIVMCHKVELD